MQKQLEEIRARKEARQSQAPASSGEGEWKQATTATGKVYYYNTKTKVTSWQRPEGYVDPSNSTPTPNPTPQVQNTPPQVQNAPPPVSSPPQSVAKVNSAKAFEIPRPGVNNPTPQITPQPLKPAVAQNIPLPGRAPGITPQSIPLPNNNRPNPVIPSPAITPARVGMVPTPARVIPVQSNPISALQSQPWYFGNISRTETETILKNCKKNGFLVRDSSQPGCYACSMIDYSKMQVHHTLIVKSPTGYHFEGTTPHFHFSNCFIHFFFFIIEQPEFGEYPDIVTLVKNTSLLQQFTPVSK